MRLVPRLGADVKAPGPKRRADRLVRFDDDIDSRELTVRIGAAEVGAPYCYTDQTKASHDQYWAERDVNVARRVIAAEFRKVRRAALLRAAKEIRAAAELCDSMTFGEGLDYGADIVEGLAARKRKGAAK